MAETIPTSENVMNLKIAKPSITSYLHYAHSLSIIETDERAREHLALSFLQLHTKPESSRKGLLLDFCEYGQIHPQCPFLLNELVVGDEIAAYGKTAVEKACRLLDEGFYVEVDLNEFHVKESLTYQVKGENLAIQPRWRRPMHFNLIYAYDRRERKFLTHGFNTELHFTEREISFSEFELAYYGDDVGMRRLRLLPEQGCDVRLYNPNKIVRYLTDFIESRCSHPQLRKPTRWQGIANALRPHASVSGFQLLGSSYGMAAYDVARQMVRRKNGKQIDIRPWCVIHDHKRSILRLCEYLVRDHGMQLDPALLEEFKLIENDFLGLRNYLLESKLTDRKVNPSSLKNNLRRLKNAERIAIGELIGIIKTSTSPERNKESTLTRPA
jgi:hypothetical protein